MRGDQPKTLIFWGRGDLVFTPAGGEAYLQDIVDRITSFYDETVK